MLCGVMAGADDFVEIERWAKRKLEFLRRLLPFVEGIPSHDTLNDVMNALPGDLFAECFTNWVTQLRDHDPEIVALNIVKQIPDKARHQGTKKNSRLGRSMPAKGNRKQQIILSSDSRGATWTYRSICSFPRESGFNQPLIRSGRVHGYSSTKWPDYAIIFCAENCQRIIMTISIRALAAALSFAVLLPSTAIALEAPQKFRADYRLSFLGFPIAKSSFFSSFSGDKFSLGGTLKSAGLARMFDRTVAHTQVSGRLSDKGIQPLNYELNYVSGGKKQLTAIRFNKGNVVSTENEPPLKKRGADWVPLRPKHLQAVFDPLTASMLRASSPREVCNHTIRAYDGEMRVNLKLYYAGMRPFSTRGFKGDAVYCKAKFEPVSGYRQGRRALDFMKYKSRMEIAFAPVGASNVYAPVAASIGTQVGTLRLRATRFGAN